MRARKDVESRAQGGRVPVPDRIPPGLGNVAGPGRHFSDVPSYRQLSDLIVGSSLSVPRVSLSVTGTPPHRAACHVLPAAPPCWPPAFRLHSSSNPSGGSPPRSALSPQVPSLACFGFASEHWSCDSKKDLKSWIGSVCT